jgi:MFS family permease
MVKKKLLNKKNETKIPWNKVDKRIMKFFMIWFIFGLFISIIVAIAVGISGFMEVVSVFIVFTLGAFEITGFMSFYYYRKVRIVSTKKVLKWFLKFSLIFGLAFAILMQVLLTQTTILDDEVVSGSTVMMVAMFLALVISGFIAGFFTFCGFFLFAFGVFGVLSIFIRRKTPDFLMEIAKITPNTTDEMKKKDKKTYRGYAWLGWAFGIPDVLDTETLTIDPGTPRQKIPRDTFKKALFLQLFFGIILVVYVSFSPFLWDYADMQTLFSNASIGTSFIPLLIIPWFIYLRLDAKIKAPVKDFRIFDGLSSRMFQTIVAFGTLFLIVRMALRNPAFVTVLQSFIIYFLFFFIGVFIITFVYFNYFEEALVVDIAQRYRELREKSDKL